MIRLVDNNNCSGCLACYNACRVGAISMRTDDTGFWFPIIDKERCVECGICIKACPAVEKIKCGDVTPTAFIAQYKNDRIRKQSTSGGAFSGIAERIIKQGGVVFGAAIDKKYEVSHIKVEKRDELEKFRSSKYVQSWIGKAYQEAELELKKNRLVCFSGTPCQIQGLKKYLGREYINLLTVDVMCRAVPSPKVFKQYLNYQRIKYPNFDRIVFRDKSRGYSYSGIALFGKGKLLYRGGSEADPWLRLFMGGYCNREICYECPYQDGIRPSDITMWDCWGTQNYKPEWDDNKGTTNIIAWTEKGKRIIDEASNLRIHEIGINNIDASLTREPLKRPEIKTQLFYRDCDSLPADVFIKKYVPMTVRVRLKKMIRVTMYKFHIHNSVRKIVHKIRKKI